jgi:putative proteasome-type protease
VVKKLNRDTKDSLTPNLLSAASMREAADYVSLISAQVQQQASRDAAGTSFEATFIFGGQIGSALPELFMIYPQGNYIYTRSCGSARPSMASRFWTGSFTTTRVERAPRCALVSMNSIIRSNITVGPPVELLIYERDSLADGRKLKLNEDDAYAREVAEKRNEGLLLALSNLPPFPWEQQTLAAACGEAEE